MINGKFKRYGERIAEWWGKSKSDVFLVSLVVLTGVLGFGLGRLSKITQSREAVRVERSLPSGERGLTSKGSETSNVSDTFVASKNGTKYFYPWCAGANLISPQNKTAFATRAEAERAGYAPAQNCKGL